jgi:hypothetical protein
MDPKIDFTKMIDLQELCRIIAGSDYENGRLFRKLKSEPDWIHDNGIGNVDEDMLVQLINRSYNNKMTQHAGGADKILDTRRLQEVVRVLTRTKNESR